MAKAKTQLTSDPNPPSGSIYHSATNSVLDISQNLDGPASPTETEVSGPNSLEDSYQMINSFDYANSPLAKSEIQQLEDFLEALAVEQKQEREFPLAPGAKSRLCKTRGEVVELKMPFAEVGDSGGSAKERMYQGKLSESTVSCFEESAMLESNASDEEAYNRRASTSHDAGNDGACEKRANSACNKRDQRRALRRETLAALKKVRRQSESSTPETDHDFESDDSDRDSISDLDLGFDSSLEGLGSGSADEFEYELEADVDEHRMEWVRELELKRTIAAVVERMVWNVNQGICPCTDEAEKAQVEVSEDEAEGDEGGERQEWRQILLAATAHLVLFGATWTLMGIPLGREI